LEGGRPDFLLGTDSLGRDFAIRLIYATRNSFAISFTAMAISITIGLILGTLSGFYRGRLDVIVSFITDVRLSIPFSVITIICAAVFGSGKTTMTLIMGFMGWAGFTRIIRGQIIQLREAPFIVASKSLGGSTFRILFEHILINIASPLIVYSTLSLSEFIMLESSMSFIGLGIQPPDVSLGKLVSEGRDHLINNWWLTILPSIIIIVIVLQIALIGDWLRDKLDPKLKMNS
jgi:peptide/nickel transport system permease protein